MPKFNFALRRRKLGGSFFAVSAKYIHFSRYGLIKLIFALQEQDQTQSKIRLHVADVVGSSITLHSEELGGVINSYLYTISVGV